MSLDLKKYHKLMKEEEKIRLGKQCSKCRKRIWIHKKKYYAFFNDFLICLPSCKKCSDAKCINKERRKEQ